MMGFFSLPSIHRSATLGLQAIISGRVEDQDTQSAPRGPITVRLIDRVTSETYPLLQRVLPDGSFVFFGKPETAFPLFATKTYQLQVEASALNYSTASKDLDVGLTPGQPALVSFTTPISGFDPIRVRSFTGGGLPIENILLSLVALP